MTTWVSRLLCFTTAMLLAAPPGWCCGVFCAPRAQPVLKPAQRHCCHQTQEPKPAPVRGAPVKACCSQPDAAVPFGPEKAHPDLAPTAATFAVLSALPAAGDAVAAASTPSCPSTSLQVLHCVWLC